jgi:hypothetical protein
MSKGSLIAILGLIIAFMPFTGFPLAVKTLVSVIAGIFLLVIGFLVRQERLWLLRTLSGEHKTDVYAENGAPYQASTREEA